MQATAVIRSNLRCKEGGSRQLSVKEAGMQKGWLRIFFNNIPNGCLFNSNNS